MSTACLVFDLDGTISDPAVGIHRSINYALCSFGHAELQGSNLSAFIGPPIDVTFRSLLPDADESHVLALVARFRERYGEVGYSENALYPGIAESLEYLVSRGARLGVCTSKRVDFAEQVLEMFDLRHHFDFVCGGDIGIVKTDQLARLLDAGTIGSGSWMIGDRAVDVLAAKHNALGSIGVLWGHGTLAELSDAGAQRLLSSPADLRTLPL